MHQISAAIRRGLIEATDPAGYVGNDYIMISAAIRRGLIEASASTRSRIPLTTISAAIRRGLIEAGPSADRQRL